MNTLIISALTSGTFLLFSVWLTHHLKKKDTNILSEDVEETINADGSRHKHEKRIFK
jgi:hypothetical protein